MNTHLLKNALASIIILLFIFSSLNPIVFGYNNKILDENNLLSISSINNDTDSVWPMFHHNIRHTGLSQYGKSGNWFRIKWRYSMDDGLLTSSPAVDNNGTIYLGLMPTAAIDCFRAINPDGTKKWSFNTHEWVHSSPAVAHDGTIYVGSDDGHLYAIYPNGTEKWTFITGGSRIYSSPTLGDDGTIYFGSTSNKFFAVNPNGTIKWVFPTGMVYSSAAIDENGIIYFGSHDTYLYALYPNGTLKWKFGTGDSVKSPPSIGSDGTIYVCSWDDYLYAINPDGSEKWSFDTGDSAETSPAINADGTIYVGSYNGRVFSIAPNGSENWMFETDDWVVSSPAIDKYGIIYFGSIDDNIYALNPDGTLKWKILTGDSIYSSPAIGEDGTIYVGSWDGYLYAIEPINNNAPLKPVVIGQANGKPRTNYTYTALTNDADDDNVSYYFDWGDGTNSSWIEFVPSGVSVNMSHSWNWRGTYTIKCKAKDVYDMEGDWETFNVKMPRDKIATSSLLLRLLESFPILKRLFNLKSY